MFQSSLLILFVVGCIACLPWLVRWGQARWGTVSQAEKQSRVLSVVAVGPQQRVVTLQVGTGTRELVLVLGVTASNITCLHKWSCSDVAQTLSDG
jgi:flagellar protein FliO/FliZ